MCSVRASVRACVHTVPLEGRNTGARSGGDGWHLSPRRLVRSTSKFSHVHQQHCSSNHLYAEEVKEVTQNMKFSPNTILSVVCALLATWVPSILACTTTGVTPGASKTGKVYASQSNDGDGVSDTRLFRVPNMTHPEGSMRPVYPYIGDFPRYVGTSRGAQNYQVGETVTKPMGFIPQVAYTHGFYDGYFGLLNDQGLGIAESTCSARIVGALPISQGGAGLWYTDELSRVAMERETEAKSAVQLMGDLAVKGGYYGGDGAMVPGESLIVSDKNEVWVFHILPSDSNGTSAIWAAQRVPDGHVVVVPNVFVLREIDFEDPDNFLFSPNIKTIAKDRGWWVEGEPFDFTKIYSGGEYNHRYYSGRRWWGAMKIFAPSQSFPEEYNDWREDAPYPFSVKPDDGVVLENVMAVMRSFYEGTKFSLTNGLKAGPFGNGNRYPMAEGAIKGNWERSIALYRTDYSYILEIDGNMTLPAEVRNTIWFGPAAAHVTEYVPFFAGQNFILNDYTIGHKGDLPDKTSAIWAFRYVQQLVNLRFDQMMKAVRNAQNVAHAKSLKAQSSARNVFFAGSNVTELSIVMNANAESVLEQWRGMRDFLVYKFGDDAEYSSPSYDTSGTASPLGYPNWWLEAVGYENGPPPTSNMKISGVLNRG